MNGEPLVAERHELPVSDTPLPTVRDLVRIVTDIEPDSGDYGPEQVLGPWADLPLDLRVRQAALAWCAWTLPVGDGHVHPRADAPQTPLDRLVRDKTLGARRRRALHALARAPTALYYLVPDGPGRFVARGDRVRLGRTCPDGPVTLDDPVVSVTDDLPGPWAMGRAARGPSGWVLVAPIAVPEAEDEPEAWSMLAGAARAMDTSVRTYADAARMCGHLWLRKRLTNLWKGDGGRLR